MTVAGFVVMVPVQLETDPTNVRLAVGVSASVAVIVMVTPFATEAVQGVA